MFIKTIKNSARNLFILIAVFLAPYILHAQKKNAITKKYGPSQLIADANILKLVVLKMHPVVGVYKSKDYHEKLFDDLIAGLKDSLTEKEFRIRLKFLIGNLHCGHSEVIQSRAYTKAVRPLELNFLPYYFVPLNNKLYVAMTVNRKRDSLYKPYTEILKINNISSDSICNYTRHFFTSDGYIASGKNIYMRGAFNYFYPSLFGRPDSFLVESKYNNNTRSNFIKAIKLIDLPVMSLMPKEDSTFKCYRRANIKTCYLDENKNALVLKIKSFKASHYKKVYRKIFRQLKKKNVENLIIDLRYNGGGNLMNSYRLLSYLLDSNTTATLKTHVKNYPLRKYTHGNLLFKFTRLGLNFIGSKKRTGDSVWYTQKIKPRKKYHFDKKIYVLINGGTFSASCMVAAYLNQTNKAVFIGAETSRAREGCTAGITPYYILPNTKIKIRVPAFRIIHDINTRPTGRGILPDYEVIYDIESILQRKDLEITKVKELIIKCPYQSAGEIRNK